MVNQHRFNRLPFTLPVGQTAEMHSRAVRTFFENLLPEGQALDDAAVTYNLSKGNVIGLLARLGQETAGALRILPPEAGSGEESPVALRLLPDAELSERIRMRPTMPFSVWDRRVRLSIAGYQDKIAVFQNDKGERFFIDGGNLASTHILKPEPVSPLLAGLTSNEYFCMKLAAAIRIPVAEVELQHVPDPILMIKRFDRISDKGRVRRLHAIDGCQALGLSTIAKYERPYGDGRDVREIRAGASLPQLFGMASAFARPVAERLALLRWTILQVLIGNTDAHAKNLTYFCDSGGLRLSPGYDIVCGLIYANDVLDDTYAMAIGDAFTAAELSPCEWANFCVLTGMPAALVRREITTLATRMQKSIQKEAEQAKDAGAMPPVVDRISECVAKECDRQIQMATGIAAMIEAARPAKENGR